MTILILFAFLAGIVTILSPCILPVLPIILSGSVSGSKKYPYGVVLGFILSFTFFTLFLSTLVKITGISADIVRIFAIVIIGVFGVVLVFPKLLIYFEIFASKLVSKTTNPNNKRKDGLLGGVLVGTSLGLIWTPCVGPILASVIALSITGSVDGQSFFIVLSYALGTAIPMFAILYGGRKLINSFPSLFKNLPKIQAFFGVIMILLSIGLYFNVERKFQAYILEKFPSYGAGLTSFENADIIKKQLNQDVTNNTVAQPAPELTGTQEWFNSEPKTLESLKGKVVLVDFWTYSCINCIRTFPYLESWYEKYKDQGFEIIAVHAPEFEFEKSSTNLQSAIDDFSITYPVVQDNDFKTWRAYKNRYWPAKYLIDAEGNIVYTHFGEGKYEETEKMIQAELVKAGFDPNTDTTKNLGAKEKFNKTPETYFNTKRIKNFASPEEIKVNVLTEFSYPKTLKQNQFAFNNKWILTSENAIPTKGSKLKMNFFAKDVYLVARPKTAGKSGKVKVTLNQESYNSPTSDLVDSQLEITTDKLYKVVINPKAAQAELELEFLDDNIEIFTFTFG